MKNEFVTCKIMTASKQIVDDLLTANTENRKLKQGVVEKYVRDINAGNWRLTHQGIALSDNGVLIDGQHRLEAIKVTGYPPVQFILVTGLSMDTQRVVDQQAKRSARDVFALHFDARVAKNIPSLCSMIWRVSHGYKTGAISIDELFDTYAKYSEEMVKIISVPKSSIYWAAPYLAAFTIVLHEKPQDFSKIESFMLRCETGENLTRTMPEYHLRNSIITSSRSGGGHRQQTERFIKAKRAILCALDDKPMGVLRAD